MRADRIKPTAVTPSTTMSDAPVSSAATLCFLSNTKHSLLLLPG